MFVTPPLWETSKMEYLTRTVIGYPSLMHVPENPELSTPNKKPSLLLCQSNQHERKGGKGEELSTSRTSQGSLTG